MSEWKEVELDSVALINPTESLKIGEFTKKIAMDNLQPFTKKPSSFSLEKFNGGMKFRNGDTIIARITPCLENGKTAYIDLLDKNEVGFGSTEYIVLRERKGVSHSHFLYYFAISPIFRDVAILSMTGSSGRQRVQTDVVKHHLFNIPSLPEQKAIAAVLSSLDDKIDLLHRQNKTLEVIVETLFRQWFIEEAHEDWEEGTLGDISRNIRNAVKPMDILADSKYVGLEHIDRRDITLKQYGLGNEVSSNKYSFEKQDILFGKLRPYFHKVCFAPFSGICSTDILVIRPKYSDWFAFCLFAFFQNDVVDYANLGSGGTRMPRTDWETVKNYPITIPDIQSLAHFNNLALPSIEKMTYNLEQIQTLQKLRDNLLPKLMSGEVRVAYEADLNREMGEAA